MLVVLAYAGDGAVEVLRVLFAHRLVADGDLTGLLIDDQAPQALEETVSTHNVLGCPRARGVQGTHGHLINTQRIGTKVACDVVRSNSILQGLTHLAVFLVDLFAVVVELAVLLLNLSGRHVHTTGIGVGVRLDITLVVQATVRLLGADVTEVEEHLVPEPCVQQVQHRVLHTTDVEVHTARIIRAVFLRLRAGPVALILQVTELVRIRRIDVAQLVPGRTCPLWHDVGVAGVLLLTIAKIQRHVHPIGGLRQRGSGLGVSILRIEGDRVVVLHIRQLDRQHGLRQRVRHTVLVVHDRERLTPVALTRKQPIAQLVLNMLLTSPFAD